ncbi:uncharacterized protein LOC123269110 [Cotesia glomerata]|uniref:uncharacterized protein LOC123269110 n=1 Tax=Cotesia glomerata TaxID=32391 RepID=UPI001D01CAE6|nr:uncharacterized protein LOC123269110 [Cotesia glomerata]
MGAVRSSYINAHPHGCYFHFIQAIIKKTSTLRLDALIGEREDIGVFIRKLLGLALLPATDIDRAFEWLINDHKEMIKELNGLISYFREYWLKVVKPERFNCYRKENKTNNNIESYHRVLRLKLGSHPSIWEFTERIATLQELAKIEKDFIRAELRNKKSRK